MAIFIDLTFDLSLSSTQAQIQHKLNFNEDAPSGEGARSLDYSTSATALRSKASCVKLSQERFVQATVDVDDLASCFAGLV